MKIKKGVLLKNENDIKINTTNQNFLEIFTIIKEKIEYIQEIIRKTILYYKKTEIILFFLVNKENYKENNSQKSPTILDFKT
jgi:hypothetical protein